MEKLEKLLWALIKTPEGIILIIVTAAIGAFFSKFLPWFFRMLGKGITELSRILSGRYAAKKWERKYLDGLIEKNQYLGLVPTVRNVPEDKSKSLRLADLEKVYTTLRLAAKDSILTRETTTPLKALSESPHMQRMKRTMAEEEELGRILQEGRRVLIQGDPGSGKTTLLRYLAVSCARAIRNDKKAGDEKNIVQKRLGWKEKPFPLFLSLIRLSDRKLFQSTESLVDAFRLEMGADLRKNCPQDFFEDTLKCRRCLILLDALDELGGSTARQAIAEKVRSLLQHYDNHRHIVVATARRVGYEGQLDAVDFKTFYIEDLDAGSRARLVKQRFRAVALDEGAHKSRHEQEVLLKLYERRSEVLLSKAESNIHLRQLTKNPLLLTLIVIIDAARIPIPDERHKLYKDCIDVLANKWRLLRYSEEAGIELPDDVLADDKIRILTELAYRMQIQRKSLDEVSLLSRAKAIEIVTFMLKEVLKIHIPKDEQRPESYHNWIAESLMDSIKQQSGILIEKGTDEQTGEALIAFSHLSFQEYLCAMKIVETKSCHDQMLEKVYDPAWREVVMLYRAIKGDDGLVRGMLQADQPQPQALLLAAACLADYSHGLESLRDDIVDQLRSRLKEKKGQISEATLHALIRIGGSGNAELLLEMIKEQEEAASVRLIAAVGNIEVDATAKREIAEKLLNMLEQPEKLTFKIKIEVGQALEKLGDPRFERDEPDMIFIPGGEFKYGDKKIKKHIAEFYIGKYPVANLEYRRFIEATGHRQPDDWKEGFYPGGHGNHPVINVDFYDAQAYCRWLSRQTGKLYRLPNEVEWEKAARGVDGRDYPWGDEYDEEKCNSDQRLGGTSPVGVFFDGASPYGIMDMAGNVWEWTDSAYGRLDEIKWRLAIIRNSSVRVLRGGSWGSSGVRVVLFAPQLGLSELALLQYRFSYGLFPESLNV